MQHCFCTGQCLTACTTYAWKSKVKGYPCYEKKVSVEMKGAMLKPIRMGFGRFEKNMFYHRESVRNFAIGKRVYVNLVCK